MFRSKKLDIEDDDNKQYDLYDELNKNKNESRFDEYDIDEDEFEDNYQYELEQAKADKKNKKKEFYVKGSELKEEIRKYQESKKNSPDRKRKNFRRTWFNDFKDLYTIFNASTF